MSTASQNDWAGKILGFFFGIGLLMMGTFFVLDRAAAILTPKQYAAARAAEEAEQAAAEARQAEVQRVADAEQAKRDEAQRKEEVTYLAASESFENFKMTLRDPQAARFRDVWAVRAKVRGFDVVAACGVVNAPNALGAYVGDTPFIAAASYIFTPDHPSFADRFQSICLDGEKVMKLRD